MFSGKLAKVGVTKSQNLQATFLDFSLRFINFINIWPYVLFTVEPPACFVAVKMDSVHVVWMFSGLEVQDCDKLLKEELIFVNSVQ